MMGALPKTSMAVPEFLSWWEKQDERARYELVDGVPLLVEQDNAGIGMARMQAYLVVRNAVEKARADCKVYGRGAGVSPDDLNYLLPDVAVDLGPHAPDDYVLANPVIIADIVSSKRKGRSTHSKLRDYLAIKSVRHYLAIVIERGIVIHHRRRGDSEVFETTFVTSGEIELSPPGIFVPVAELLEEGADT
jgi:Uma2 family endonuclease